MGVCQLTSGSAVHDSEICGLDKIDIYFCRAQKKFRSRHPKAGTVGLSCHHISRLRYFYSTILVQSLHPPIMVQKDSWRHSDHFHTAGRERTAEEQKQGSSKLSLLPLGSLPTIPTQYFPIIVLAKIY